MFNTNGRDLKEKIEEGDFVTIYYDGTKTDPEDPFLYEDGNPEDGSSYFLELGFPPVGHLSGYVQKVYPNTVYLSKHEGTGHWDYQIDYWEIVDIV